MRWLIIAQGQGTDPDDAAAWPVFATSEPDNPDNCITVKNTAGRDSGRVMQDGERQVHYGFQVRVRSLTAKAGFAKASAIAINLDQNVYDVTITIDSNDYLVHSVTRTTDVLDIGKDVPGSKRSLHTLNGIVTINQV